MAIVQQQILLNDHTTAEFGLFDSFTAPSYSTTLAHYHVYVLPIFITTVLLICDATGGLYRVCDVTARLSHNSAM